MPRHLPDLSQDRAVASSRPSEIDRFLKKAEEATAVNGRLIFALDATLSRQPTWDRACRLQAEMFGAVSEGLSVQLVYFRGFDECRASKWVARPQALRDLMLRIDCRGGQTQIERILKHVRGEAGKTRVGALVFIGDAVEENPDSLCRMAGELGVLGVPCFMVQEGTDRGCEAAFREIARLSRGAYLRLDEGSADALRNLLRAVASFAAGGLPALERDATREGQLLLAQMRGQPPR
ncbi:VWA domain-containing protein [Aureimonas populi]|uniref:VWA domain-containing protein n=1 Tax=Aureimonas populi TaxID=1701758 RepID=A0ABW5CR04_9HYPH|nr:VWA domain-containing protein [Aureimonas populi]